METIEQLRKEREILQQELYRMSKIIDKLTNALNVCRQEMLPLDVAKVIDRALQEVEDF